jgi:hypothetical protein
MATGAARSKPTPNPGAAATPTPPRPAHRDTRDPALDLRRARRGVCSAMIRGFRVDRRAP